jgi:DNA-binding IclR family transcriptional regulator
VSSDLHLNKRTAHRFLSALVDRGYVREDEARRYLPSTKLIGLGSKALDRIEIRSEIRPYLEAVARESGETAHLAILDGWEIVYIDKVEGRGPVKMASRIGGRGRCHSTALGKVLLAHHPEADWTHYVQEKGLEPRTPRTLTDPERFA